MFAGPVHAARVEQQTSVKGLRLYISVNVVVTLSLIQSL
jgi:hypothetical protein